MNDLSSNKWHGKLPPQQLPFKRKGREWRKAHLDWADSKTFFNYSPVRHSVLNKKINQDLVNGIIHIEDVEKVLNPDQIKEKFTPNTLQHYPIINTKLEVLIGEERDRPYDFRVIVTNPIAISQKEENKKAAMLQQLQAAVSDTAQSEEDFQKGLQKMSDFFLYEWQDMREARANQLLNHYIKEYNIPLMFVDGFRDALVFGEEIYQCDIRGGEPIIERVNPLKIRIFRSGVSNKIEDADVIILEDYWSPAKVIDAYYDSLTKKDIEYLENAPDHLEGSNTDSRGFEDERRGLINMNMIDDVFDSEDHFLFTPFGMDESYSSLMPFDSSGNVRVIRMYWKSRRKIKKVKRYNPQTGEEEFNFYDEDYIEDKNAGEEVTPYYINQAWEGTKIGEDIYVNMGPRPVQYNRLSNPSRCHFGIVGSVYNFGDTKPFSMVDRMKPFAYLYDVIHDRLNKVMARNWGKLVKVDLALIPKSWDFEKWLYYAKHNNMIIQDSFNEGNKGAATGKLAGSLNNNSNGVVDAELGNCIQQYINTLEFIKMEMAEVAGITRQREGQVSNRETVGGVERATLQSAHITEYWFAVHSDVKRRALECFLETAKIALKGRKEKFQYILSDGSLKIAEIDGDDFAEADYGIVGDASNDIENLKQKIEGIAQAALQSQAVSFSTIMKIYSSASFAEKMRLVERDEQRIQEQQQQQQQQQLQVQQEQAQMQMQLQQAQMEQQDMLNQRDNETKITVATIQAEQKDRQMYLDSIQETDEPVYSEEAKAKLMESMRQFDEKLRLDRDRLNFERSKAKDQLSFDKDKAKKDAELKLKALKMKPKTTSTKK